MRKAGSPRNKPSVFPTGLFKSQLSHLSVDPMTVALGGGAQLTLMESLCGSFDTKTMGIFAHACEGRPLSWERPLLTEAFRCLSFSGPPSGASPPRREACHSLP